MSEQQPPLEYQGTGSPPPLKQPGGRGKFLTALLLGTGISAILWIAGWKQFAEGSYGAVLIGWPALKIVVGIVLFFVPNWRSFSAGLFASLGLGTLIFIGTCGVKLLNG